MVENAKLAIAVKFSVMKKNHVVSCAYQSSRTCPKQQPKLLGSPTFFDTSILPKNKLNEKNKMSSRLPMRLCPYACILFSK